MSATPLVVSIQGVVTRFGRNLVHDGVDLDIARGEIVALVGGSGSGKTTLLRHLIGLTRPAAGRIELFGEALDAGGAAQRKARMCRFGVLFQHGALFSAFSVGENIGFPLKMAGMPKAEAGELPALCRLVRSTARNVVTALGDRVADQGIGCEGDEAPAQGRERLRSAVG